MNNQNQSFESALGWDSQISQESSFILLEAGNYAFTVEKMERSTFNPSPSSSIRDASPMAELELKIDSPQGTAIVFENLILHTKTEWKLSEFFTAIGQKKSGVPFTPDWSGVIGATGYCKISQNNYTNKNGDNKTNNRVERFLTPEDGQSKVNSQPQATQSVESTQPAQPAAQTQPVQPQATQQPSQPQVPQAQPNQGFNF